MLTVVVELGVLHTPGCMRAEAHTCSCCPRHGSTWAVLCKALVWPRQPTAATTRVQLGVPCCMRACLQARMWALRSILPSRACTAGGVPVQPTCMQ